MLAGNGMTLAGTTQKLDPRLEKLLRRKFSKMMSALYKEEGASLRIDILGEKEVQSFIDTHARALDSAFDTVGMSDTMRNRLQQSDWIFSGMKTFHELNEAFPSLLDADGHKKSFNQFLDDVQRIDDTYNRHYLKTEYNFAGAAATMAARWEQFEEDGDRYLLQYRTAGDDAVRPEHAALHGVTLPPSDSFWDAYYPPNGWNCRCTVVQVRRSSHEQTPHDDAMTRGAAALARDQKGMFRFNPGKQKSAFPDYNPYTRSKCNTCTRKLNLAKDIADNELCEACLTIRSMAKKEMTTKLGGLDRKEIREATNEWIDRHLPETTLPNGEKAKRLVVDNNGNGFIVNKRFFSETFAQNIRYGQLAETMEFATQVDIWLPDAVQIRTETGKHHPCDFLVYEALYKGVRIQCKIKDQAEKMVYTMRIFKK